ncbi:LysR family transcriptional regulator [Wohlfahrtiimonas larvae]|nr:LysR family transcriptional regulator [Wohlfahrtiimonas larvae]
MKNYLNYLYIFSIVAKEQSFTRAAAKLGTSQSSISQSMKNLEKYLGIKLLSRTTRSVLTTAAGNELLIKLNPALQEIDYAIQGIQAFKSNPKGTLKINSDEYALDYLLWPILSQIILQYPEISFEITSDYRLMDIVAEGFDIGLRRGKLLSNDMTAMRISDPIQMCCVASHSYLQQYGIPKAPQELHNHRTINIRLPTHGELFRWHFIQNEQTIYIQPNSQIVFTSIIPIIQAVKKHLGIAYVPKNMIDEDLKTGELQLVLEKWQYTYEPYYLYYPHSKEDFPLLKIFLNAIQQYKRPHI